MDERDSRRASPSDAPDPAPALHHKWPRIWTRVRQSLHPNIPIPSLSEATSLAQQLACSLQACECASARFPCAQTSERLACC